MYRALLVADDHASARFLLKKIPKSDPDVIRVIKQCQKSYDDLALEKLTRKVDKNPKEVDLSE